MTPQFLLFSKPVHTKFTLYDFPRGGYDWLGQIFLNRELQLISTKSFFLFIMINLNNDYFLIYMHLFASILLGFLLKLI